MRYLVLVVVGLSGMVAAQNSMPSFEEVDANGDGRITQQEAQSIEGLDFAAADANQDGYLSRAEYAALESD
jgi:hypothetical protein